MRATRSNNLIILYFITLIVFGEELVKQGTSYQKKTVGCDLTRYVLC